jgi:hypothetical protein
MAELLNRIFYTMLASYRQRRAIAKIYRETPHRYSTLHIRPHELKQQGIEILVLDFDGVLAEYGVSQPHLQLHSWLAECITIFGTDHIFILSNRPSPDRISYFKQHFVGVRFIKPKRKKPYPDGLEQIMQLTQRPPETLTLVDDRLLTGILAACITKTHAIYITHPYTNLSERPLQEFFFMSLRLLERFLIQSYCLIKRRDV